MTGNTEITARNFRVADKPDIVRRSHEKRSCFYTVAVTALFQVQDELFWPVCTGEVGDTEMGLERA
jgi:hypothetical protein